MKTRSQSKMFEQREQYIVDIDFDGASEAWKANKISKGNGTYVYRCISILKKGLPCCQAVSGRTEYCKRHLCGILLKNNK